jgi:hypothetical protein
VVQPFLFSPMADGGIVDAGLYEQQMQEASQRAIDKIGEAARAAGVPFEGVVAVSPSPHEKSSRRKLPVRHHPDGLAWAQGLEQALRRQRNAKVLAHTHLPVMVLR